MNNTMKTTENYRNSQLHEIRVIHMIYNYQRKTKKYLPTFYVKIFLVDQQLKIHLYC